MSEKPMSKTRAKQIAADIRRESKRITDILTPTPAWILREVGLKEHTPEQVAAVVEEALNNIDGLSAQLREAYAPDSY